MWTWSSTTSSRGEAPAGAQAKGRPIRGGGRAQKTACSSPSRRVSKSRKAESSRGERDETRNRNSKASARVRRPFGEEESLTVRSSRCHASCPSPSLGSLAPTRGSIRHLLARFDLAKFTSRRPPLLFLLHPPSLSRRVLQSLASSFTYAQVTYKTDPSLRPCTTAIRASETLRTRLYLARRRAPPASVALQTLNSAAGPDVPLADTLPLRASFPALRSLVRSLAVEVRALRLR